MRVSTRPPYARFDWLLAGRLAGNYFDRISGLLGKQTTHDDIDFAIKVIPETIVRLREISPVCQNVGADSRR